MRRLIRSHLPPHLRLSGSNTDVLVYLAYLLFLHKLANESRLRMQMEQPRNRTISRRHVVGAGRTLLRRRGAHIREEG